jgi:hypothetical protein
MRQTACLRCSLAGIMTEYAPALKRDAEEAWEK